MCLMAFATLNHNPGAEVLAAVRKRIATRVDQFDTQKIANCLWALALLQALPAATWNSLVGAFTRLLDPQSSLPGETSSPTCNLPHDSAAPFAADTNMQRMLSCQARVCYQLSLLVAAS